MKKLISVTTLLSLFVILSVTASVAGASEVTGTLSSEEVSTTSGGSASGSIGGSVTGGNTISGTVTGGGGGSGGGGGGGLTPTPTGQVLGAATVTDPGTYPSFPSTGRAK